MTKRADTSDPSFQEIATMEPKADLRRPMMGDVPRLAELELDCFPYEDAWDVEKLGEWVQDASRSPMIGGLVCLVEGRLVGYCFGMLAGHTMYIKRLGVDPVERRRGIASELVVNQMVKDARVSVGRAKIEVKLVTKDTWTSSHLFLKANGFTGRMHRPLAENSWTYVFEREF